MPLVCGWYGEVNKTFEQLLGVAAQLGSLSPSYGDELSLTLARQGRSDVEAPS